MVETSEQPAGWLPDGTPEGAMPEAPSDETDHLLAQIESGNTAAFEVLFARYRAYVARVVELRLDARLRARVDPSDLIQETQLVAFRQMDDYLRRRPMPFRLWLRQTACEQVLKAARYHLAAKRSATRERAWPERSSLLLLRSLGLEQSTPSERMARKERTRAANAALELLSASDREILILRQLEELSYEEISHLLQITPPTARKRYGRALLQLRAVLRGQGFLESGHE